MSTLRAVALIAGLLCAAEAGAQEQGSEPASSGVIPAADDEQDAWDIARLRRDLKWQAIRAEAARSDTGVRARARSALDDAAVPATGPLPDTLPKPVVRPVDSHPLYRDYLRAIAAEGEPSDDPFDDRPRISYGVAGDGLEEVVLLKDAAGANVCSGSLMTSDTVITAAHCLCSGVATVVFGLNDTSTKRIAVVDSRIVAGGTGSCLAKTKGRDLALLKLETPAGPDKSRYLVWMPGPADVPNLLVNWNMAVGMPYGTVRLAGFGYDHTGSQGIRRTARVPVLDHDCRAQDGPATGGTVIACKRDHEFVSTMIDARPNEPPSSTCEIDSGGPAFAEVRVTPGGTAMRRYQVGVASRADNGPHPCGTIAQFTRFSPSRLAFLSNACRAMSGTGCP